MAPSSAWRLSTSSSPSDLSLAILSCCSRYSSSSILPSATEKRSDERTDEAPVRPVRAVRTERPSSSYLLEWYSEGGPRSERTSERASERSLCPFERATERATERASERTERPARETSSSRRMGPPGIEGRFE
eukprot:CAMPEP_0180001852 /NCGR_PEP_ID=MMETSP0984-20121128/10628_1 /TAXON_ID=483367 /ORGANISM="non described non described, Strain CCMP 2436" /LENGTH=132 /DNA_ID=CAMNT_0021922015 /DNA_START=440 /DNA_END=838 /DNA_ORIENTATION=+